MEDKIREEKRRKLIAGYYVASMVAISVRWHAMHMVKEPSRDLRSAREFYLRKLFYETDSICKDQLRVDKNTFSLLYRKLVEKGGLRPAHVTIEEAVAIFLYVLGHRLKNRVVAFNFMRSGETATTQMVLEELSKIEGLDQTMLLNAVDEFINDQRTFETLAGLSNELKKHYVLLQLGLV